MSYQHIWGGVIETRYFKVHDCQIPNGGPGVCPVHTPYCFRMSVPFMIGKSGHISLIDPANLDVMAGAQASILTLSVDAMISNVQWGFRFKSDRIKLMVDGANVFERSIDSIPWDSWQTYSWKVSKDITNAHILDIDLFMDIEALIGFCTLHNTNITLLGDVWNDTPSPKASVELTVVNINNNKPIKNARVTLMVGTRVLQDGYTNSAGVVTFANMDEGSCMAKVSASGYYILNQSISISAPSSIYTVSMVPIPTVPIPDWVWYAVAGVAAVGAIIAVPAIIKSRQKPEERIIMMR